MDSSQKGKGDSLGTVATYGDVQKSEKVSEHRHVHEGVDMYRVPIPAVPYRWERPVQIAAGLVIRVQRPPPGVPMFPV